MNQQYKGPLDYVDVATRIVDFRQKYPEGCLRQGKVEFIDFAGKSWVVYTAEAWRSPDDPAPAHGTAWEPVPGPTPFTRDSELQNAETAAWGRAIVAALAADTKHGIASSEEVRNRAAARDPRASAEQREGFTRWLGEVKDHEKMPAKWDEAVTLGMTAQFKDRYRELFRTWIEDQDDVDVLESRRKDAVKNGLVELLDGQITYCREMERRVSERVETVTPEVVDDGAS